MLWKAGAAVLAAGILLHYLLMDLNYRHNRKNETQPPRVLNDQHGAFVSGYRFGLRNARYVGCEAIAIHNARLFQGRDSTLSGVIRDVERSCAPILYGVFGTDPLAIGRVLRAEGTAFRRVDLADTEEEGVYILSFWNGRGIREGLHTVCMVRTPRGPVTCNLTCDGRISRRPPQAYAERFICGYFLGPADPGRIPWVPRQRPADLHRDETLVEK